jgi:hypothetical protein
MGTHQAPRRTSGAATHWLRGLRARGHATTVEFCEACSDVCDAACRSGVHRRRTQAQIAGYVVRI